MAPWRHADLFRTHERRNGIAGDERTPRTSAGAADGVTVHAAITSTTMGSIAAPASALPGDIIPAYIGDARGHPMTKLLLT